MEPAAEAPAREDGRGSQILPRPVLEEMASQGLVLGIFPNTFIKDAVLDLPLGSTRPLGFCAMINLIGSVPTDRSVLAEEGLHVHLYGKQPRPGRKLGHWTIVEGTRAARDRRARRLLARLAPAIRIP